MPPHVSRVASPHIAFSGQARALHNDDPASAAAIVATSPARWPLRGLILDMGDVLYDATAWRRWLHGLLHHLGVLHDYAALFARWDRDHLDAVHQGRREYHSAFVAFLQELGLPPAQIDEVCAASAARRREIAAALRPLPGVRATLERLRGQGFHLAVLSDSEDSAPRLRERLAALGIGATIEAVVSSRDLGCTKPAPACYEAALGALGLHAAQAAFVGHDAEELRGAAAVGLRTIAFNQEPLVEAELYLSRFEELTEHVAFDGERQPLACVPCSTSPVVVR